MASSGGYKILDCVGKGHTVGVQSRLYVGSSGRVEDSASVESQDSHTLGRFHAKHGSTRNSIIRTW